MFHFATGIPDFLPVGNPIRELSSYGGLGVPAFFAVSGFVIPYSMYLRSYRIKDCCRFFVRRLKRLEPPYLAAICLVLLLSYLSSLVKGTAFGVTWPQLLAHLGYLNAILDLGWLDDVYWTLAIEFQYYIFMALAFPLLGHERLKVRVISVIGVALLGYSHWHDSALRFLPHWLPLFAMGMVTFQSFVGKLSRPSYVVVLSAIAAISFHIVGPSSTIVGICTAVCIFAIGFRDVSPILAPLAFLGTISYSLYLTHGPVGGRVVRLAYVYLPDSVGMRYVGIIVALGVSVLFAYVFWWCVERPSQRWTRATGRAIKPKEATSTPLQDA